jgi:kumamolisin
MATIPKHHARLAGSELKLSHGIRHLGPADANEAVTVTIVVRRRASGSPLPDHDYFLRTPPARRRRLPTDQFAARYGAELDDLRRVSDFVTASGLRVLETHPARRSVKATGTVAQMNAAFGVTLGRYERTTVRRRGGQPHAVTYRAYEGFIHVPAELTEVIVGVFGLDNQPISKRNSNDPPGTAPIPTTTITSLYDFPTNAATGQTIGIVSLGGYDTSDVNAPFATPPTITPIDIDGASNLGAGFDSGETTQDICIAALAAPGAAIAVYFIPDSSLGWVDMVQRIVHPDPGDPVCSVFSSSFYISDGDDLETLANESISVAFVDVVSAAFHDAAIQGVTVCIAAGDTGANSKVGANPGAWGLGFPGDGKAHVQYPGSDPWVLCVGGTTIGSISGTSFDEYVWNDPPSNPQAWGTTGGGVSAFFDQPSYQAAAGVPVSINDGHIGRGTPDVAANASANSGYFGLTYEGNPFVGNGTSASSPLWAGLIAIINAALLENVGFVNPAIYALGSSVFRDIDPPPGPTNNSNAGIPGYTAGPGWDACTGWGSPRGTALLAGLHRLYGRVIAVNGQDNLTFGTVCHTPAYKKLEVFNIGDEKLFISSITVIGSPAFSVLPMPAVPAGIPPGDHLDFTIEYNPAAHVGLQTATIRIVSDDAVTPILNLPVSGTWGTSALVLGVADSGNFGNVCLGSFADEPLVINNAGQCMLFVSSITASSAEFLVPSSLTYPLAVAPGASVALPIRFQPLALGPTPAGSVITVTSNDPDGSKSVTVSGFAPSGKITLTGSTFFGAVPACCPMEKTISICNTGDCKLHVSHVGFRRKSRHWKLINSPFPATLHPGSCLGVVVRYKADENYPRACELVIASDDPAMPVKTVELIATTVWDECGCRKCCDDCQKGCCGKRHCEPRRCKVCHGGHDDEPYHEDADDDC